MKKNSTIDDYKDILNLPHPESKKHERMPALSRAAQFAPFAALTGFGEQIADTEKKSEEKRSL